MTYFNTTNIKDRALYRAIAKANNQREKIMLFMEANKSKSFTPAEVHDAIFEENTPLTSVRARMTTLAQDGYLEQTNEQREGVYGVANYCWIFRKSL